MEDPPDGDLGGDTTNSHDTVMRSPSQGPSPPAEFRRITRGYLKRQRNSLNSFTATKNAPTFEFTGRNDENDEALPAFHVVAPSIPGYGFFPSPKKPRFGYRRAGHAFHALMKKLGYDKYVIQGGDAGDFILRYQAHDFPDNVVSGLSNFWVIPPSVSDLERYQKQETSEDENYIVSLIHRFSTEFWGIWTNPTDTTIEVGGGDD